MMRWWRSGVCVAVVDGCVVGRGRSVLLVYALVLWCLAWFGGAVGSVIGQVVMMMVRSWAREVLNCSRHGHRVGRCRV